MQILIWGKHAVESAKKHGKILRILSEVETNKLGNVNHQNIAAIVDYKLYSIDVFFSSKKILILDGVTDTRNLGSIIRTASVLGWQDILLCKKNKSSINGTVAKVASGGLHIVRIAIDDIEKSITQFSNKGFKIIGIDERGKSEDVVCDKKVIVLGDEHIGLRYRNKCDILWSIRNSGCLNVAVAAGIAMYQLS